MSFDLLEKPVLLKVAESFGVEVAENARSKTIITALETDGVTFAQAAAMVPEVAALAPAIAEQKEEEKKEAADTLVKMTRQNFSFQIRGYQFTREAPFALMTTEDAEYVTENVEGFRFATPKELQEFYR